LDNQADGEIQREGGKKSWSDGLRQKKPEMSEPRGEREGRGRELWSELAGLHPIASVLSNEMPAELNK